MFTPAIGAFSARRTSVGINSKKRRLEVQAALWWETLRVVESRGEPIRL